MKRRSRTVRVAKWVAFIVCMLSGALVLASCLWPVRLSGTPQRYYEFASGGVHDVHRYPRCAVSVEVLSIWPVFFAALICTAAFWALDAPRRPDGTCGQCGYDLTGNVSGVCPECGTEIRQEEHSA